MVSDTVFLEYRHCLVLWEKTNYIPACDVTLFSRAVSLRAERLVWSLWCYVCGLVRLVVCGNLHPPPPPHFTGNFTAKGDPKIFPHRISKNNFNQNEIWAFNYFLGFIFSKKIKLQNSSNFYNIFRRNVFQEILNNLVRHLAICLGIHLISYQLATNLARPSYLA